MSSVDSFIYRIGSVSSYLGRPPVFYSTSGLSQSNMRFASVYAVRQEDANLIQEAGTAAGFKGIVWSEKLWIDIDGDQEATKRAISSLKELGYAFSVYTTGNRGCHISVTRHARPSHLLPVQDKQWVKANVPGADLSLYWHLHLLRLPGAIHEETGKPKQIILEVDGKALELPAYIEESSSTRNIPCEHGRQPVFTTWEVIKNLSGGKVGNRHQQLLSLAGALKKESGVSIEEALWVCSEVNKGFDEPKEQEEVDRIVKWMYGS